MKRARPGAGVRPEAARTILERRRPRLSVLGAAGLRDLRAELDASLLSQVRAEAGEQRAAILRHKLDSLVTECAGYLNVALKAAEVANSEREELRRKILGQKESLDDARLALKLIVRHATANTRPRSRRYSARRRAGPAKAEAESRAGVPSLDPQPACRDREVRRLAARGLTSEMAEYPSSTAASLSNQCGE